VDPCKVTAGGVDNAVFPGDRTGSGR
jgi:hypothetical protein